VRLTFCPKLGNRLITRAMNSEALIAGVLPHQAHQVTSAHN
jgi:hypothetical protein